MLSAVDAGLPVDLTNDKGQKANLSLILANMHPRTGNTLLMLAAYAGHTDLTKGLLERGADPNRVNDLGQSIIAGAVFKGHNEIVNALMAKQADPRLGTPNAIQAAHMFKRTELTDVLGTRDEDLNAVPTPLPTGGNP